jgi:predicted lipid-binding transport protein (Tim44 family)
MVMPGLTGLFMERAGAGAMTYLILASMAATVVAFLAILAFRMRRSELPAPIESQPASS